MTIAQLALAVGFPAHPPAAGPAWVSEGISAGISLVFTLWLVRGASRRARGAPPRSAARVLPFVAKHELLDTGHDRHRLRGR